jgi:hypothetical protein
LLWLLASLTALAAIREMDANLDKIIPVLGWKVGYLVLVYPVIRVIAWRDAFRQQLGQFVNSLAFPVLWAGFIVAIPVSQLLGHGPLLKSLMGDDYKGQYKRMIEESGEMIGYMLLLAGAVECWFLVRNRVAGGAARPTADAG